MTLPAPELVADWDTPSIFPTHVLDAGGTIVAIEDEIHEVPSADVWASEEIGPVAGWDGSAILGSESPDTYVSRTTTSTHDATWSDVVGSSSIDQVSVGGGKVWATTNQREIYRFSTSGALERTYNESIASGPTIPDGPRGLAVDGGVIYLAAFDGIWTADPGDEYQDGSLWRLPFTQHHSTTGDWRGVAVGSKVYVSNRNGAAIYSMPLGGGSLTLEYQGNTTDDTDSMGPYGMSVIGNWLYVADSFMARIYRFALSSPSHWRVGRIGWPA